MHRFFDDEHTWEFIFKRYSNSSPPAKLPAFAIYFAAVSEWVARVPGLYWLPGSAGMRQVNPAQIESETKHWRIYSPLGKSQLVSGGVGTLRFPPAEDGFRLATLTVSCNASSGVPVLIAPEVWAHHRLAEGRVIHRGMAQWQEMPLKWAAQFPVLQGIPRGCLVLDKVEAISTLNRRAPILTHPFSIMEYWDGTAQLYDFVYATADTAEKNYRGQLATFFEQYRKEKGREGVYLTSADIAQPMWDAEFADPADMRQRRGPQLRLIERRVTDAAKGIDIVDALIKKLSSLPAAGDLKQLSAKADIDVHRWSKGGLIAEEANRLVDVAVASGKHQALLQAVQFVVAS